MTKYKVGITGKNINLCCMNAERPSLCTENTCSVISWTGTNYMVFIIFEDLH